MSHRVNFVVLRWVARTLPSVWILPMLRDVTGHEMKVARQRKRVSVDLDELVARGRLAGGLQSSMVIEEVGSSDFILVDRLHDVVGFAGMVLSLDFFSSCYRKFCSFSLPLGSLACSDVGFYGTPHLVHAIAVLIVFTA